MSSVLELRHLATLQAIDEAGSLVEAAERLHVTQSALSHQLKDLEHRLGVALIVRRTRPIRFTTAGGRVLALARQVLWNVRQQEVVTLGELGPMLIPARKGFTLNEQGLRFNPSYLPEFQLRYFAAVDSSGPWAQMLRTADDLFGKAQSNGVMPDWFEYYMASGVRPDAKTGGVSSYDAIRVYLWAGMTPNSRWLAQLAPYVKIIEKRGFPPERVEPRSQAITEGQPLGFSAAVLPFLSALNEDTLLKKQLERLSRSRVNGGLGDPAHYYDQVLALFGEGWVSDRYQFDEDGKLMPRWRRTCCSALQR